MAVKKVSINRDAKIFPELRWVTNGQTTLAKGPSQIFKLENIESRNQIVKVLKLGMEAHDDSFITLIADGRRRDSIHTLAGPGINTPVSIFGDHEIDFASKELIVDMANNSSADTDNRQAMQYIVDANDTMRKLQQGIPLSREDNNALAELQTPKGKELAGMDPLIAARLGIGVPKRFADFLTIHEVRGSRISNFPRGTNLSTSEQDIINEDVPNVGEEALVLERLVIERPSQGEVGEVEVNVYADDQSNAVMTLDPACFPGAPFTTDGNTGSTDNMSTIDLHVHAFEKLQVTVKKASGTHNNFKAVALASVRKVGVGFKAKLEEFLGTNRLPSVLDITSRDRELIDDLMLRQLARTGILTIS